MWYFGKNINKIYVSKCWRSAASFQLSVTFSVHGFLCCQQKQHTLLRSKSSLELEEGRQLRNKVPINLNGTIILLLAMGIL